MNSRQILLYLLLILAMAIAHDGQAAQNKQPKTGGTLVCGLAKEPANPNPFIATDSISQFVKETSYESLLTSDFEGRIVPNLAVSYEVSASGTEFTLHLRKGVKFHNGKEMTADDVIWSARHVKDPKNSAFGQKLINDAKYFEKMDNYTVKFTLNHPSAAFLSHLSNIRMLPIVPENSLKPGQTRLDQNTFVPGTGPFIFESYQPGFDKVLKKFPAYWGGAAYLDKIVFRPIADGANRFNALRSGDVQFADRLSTMDTERVKKGQVKGIVILDDLQGGFQHILFNYDNPLFAKLEMRQALLYAIDKQRLVDENFLGAAIPSDLKMGGIWAKEANIPAHKRDLVKAKNLMKAAGYKGQELAMIAEKAQTEPAESLQRMFAEAGVKVKLEILEGGIKKERSESGKFDLNFSGGNLAPDPVITMMNEYYTNKTAKGRYSNPRADQLLENLDKNFDEKRRLKIFKDLAWIIHNDVASIPLFFVVRSIGMSEKVQGFGPPEGYEYSETGNYFKRVWLQ